MDLHHGTTVLDCKGWRSRPQAVQQELQACMALLYFLVLCWRSLTPVRLLQLRDEVAKYKVGAPARVGLVAPNDVIVPGGNTGLDPSQTSFFQVCLAYQDVMLEALLLGCPASDGMLSMGLQSICRNFLCWPRGS